jgi:hypothetical protein
LRRSFTQQQTESLAGSRYPAPVGKILPRLPPTLLYFKRPKKDYMR